MWLSGVEGGSLPSRALGIAGRDGVWLMIWPVMSNIIEVIFVEKELLLAEFHYERGTYDV